MTTPEQQTFILNANRQGNSLASIVRDTGLKWHWVKKVLHEAGEPSRRIRLTRETKINQNQKEMIDGLLLSDASIGMYYDAIMGTFDLGSKHLEFAQHVVDELFPMECRIRHRAAQNRILRGKEYVFNETFSVITKPDLALNEFYKKWYPDKKKKIVPDDIQITPIAVKYWFIGDGWSSYVAYKDISDAYVKIGLCTNSFTVQECEMLINKMQKQIGVEFSIQYAKKRMQPMLCLAGSNSINKFFDYIGECNIECFQYKWKRPNREISEFAVYRWDEKHLK